ncbi:hypothetical protein M0R72_19245 [Candidatus Pacearchaeota archaeon]|jgi:hypothetical protein|nr:hypothetical protein [Candidatus Pacearchaeota archaeon]
MTKYNYEGGLELEILAARHGLEIAIKNAKDTLAYMEADLVANGTPGFYCPTDAVVREYHRLIALQQALALYREGKA